MKCYCCDELGVSVCVEDINDLSKTKIGNKLVSDLISKRKCHECDVEIG